MLTYPGIKLVTDGFRTAVYCKMLRTCRRLQMLRILSLKTSDISTSEFTGQIRILSVCLMTSAPSRIAEDIDIRSPEGQSLIDSMVTFSGKLIKLCTPLR